MRVFPHKLAWFQLFGAFFLALAVFLFFFVPLDFGALSALPALIAGALYFMIVMRKYFRRRRTVREPFPESWRAELEKNVVFYTKLDDDGRKRFERDVQIFLSEQRIYGVRNQEVRDEVKVLVAASAAMLCHGRPEMEWTNVSDIVIYPRSFNEDYEVDQEQTIAGMVHSQGPIIFSSPELSYGFQSCCDGYNPGVHELAHVLDHADGTFDGVPEGAEWISTAPWVSVVADRLEKVRRGKKGALRSYAGENEVELFAVAVEAFFEKPHGLAKKDAELFNMLAEYFNLDPRTGKLLSEL